MGPKPTKLTSAFIWAPVLLGSVIAIFLPKFFSNQMEKARDSFSLTNLAAISAAQSNYHKEFGHYGQTFEEIHFGHDGEGVTYFLKKEEVPEAILKLVPEADHPYVSDQSYRVLFVWQRSPDVEASIWVMSENGRPRKIR